MSNNRARSAVGKDCASTELTGINPGPHWMTLVRALLLTSTEPGFYARDSQRQLRPTEDVPHGTATGPVILPEKLWIQVWSRGGPKPARHCRAWMGEIQEKRSSYILTLLLHHHSREVQGNTLPRTSSPFPKLLTWYSWCRQPRLLPGFPGKGLAMAVSSRMLHIFLGWTRKTQHEMYCCITHTYKPLN